MKQFRTICIGLDQFWTKHTVEVCVPYIQKRVRCNGKNASIFHTYRVCCCYSWGTLRAIYTHAIILTKPPNGKKQTANGISMLIFRQLWNEWVSLHTHTWTLKHTHVSSSIELACCRLLPCCLCMCLSEILFLLLYACDDFCLLAFIFPHLYSTVVRRFFFHFITSLFHYSFLFLSSSRFHFLFVVCVELFSSLLNCCCIFCGIFFIISFALPVLVLLRLLLFLLSIPLLIASISFCKHISVAVPSHLNSCYIPNQMMHLYAGV